MASVLFEHVTKRFGDVAAVTDFSLAMEDGEFVVLVGPSGSGKTTALRLLAGLEALSAGTIRIGDRPVDRLPPRDRDIAMVFQDYALYPQMSVFDNMAFGLQMRRVPKAETRRRVAAGAQALGLDPLLDRKPRQLSGGQRQRVALGRALVRSPQVFLMDEPLSNLDAKLRVEMRGEIKRLQALAGTTTLYVTHDQVEAMTMGDRLVVMRGGRIEQAGTPHELYERPCNAFVAAFIGSPAMNLIEMEVHPGAAGPALVRGPLSIPAAGLPTLPDRVLLGVRPEHVAPWREDGGLLGPVEGETAYVEALGRETVVGVTLDDETIVAAILDGMARVRIGERFRAGFPRERLHLFAADTGRALGPA